MLCLTRWQRRLLRHKKTPSDMEAKTLVDALRYALEEKNADTTERYTRLYRGRNICRGAR